MLTTLRIQNLALVANLTLELEPGFNVISGETGAGKSIIMGALNLVLGQRADRNLLRAGATTCSVEAVFDISALSKEIPTLLESSGLEPCEEGLLLIKRSFTASGTNRQFINGSPTTLSLLAKLGEHLVDIHGPHDHQSLLDPHKQLLILDAFGNLNSHRQEFASVVQERNRLFKQQQEFAGNEQTYNQQLDLLRFQVNEISAAKLDPEEEQTLEQDYQRATHAARLLELTQSALNLLNDQDPSLFHLLGGLGQVLQDCERLDKTTESWTQTQIQASELLSDLSADLTRYVDRMDLEPARLTELEERLNLIQSLKRKYGSSISEILDFGENAQQKLQNLEQREYLLEKIAQEIQAIDRKILKLGQALSRQRRELVPKLCQKVMGHLKDLGFAQAHFDIAIQSFDPSQSTQEPLSELGLDSVEFQFQSSPSDPARSLRTILTSTGLDTIGFQFAPNLGEPPRPLEAIASSGELARVMLALKTVLASEDEIPVLVFDEVDANVGGETARKVGEKLLQVGSQKQVFCITHLPPVAACGQTHFKVSKSTRDGRTLSEIEKLSARERVTEIARMLGDQSPTALKHAEALLAPHHSQ